MSAELRGSLLTLPQRVQSAPSVAQRVVVAAAGRVVAAAKGPWPVKSGRSKGELRVVVTGRQVRIVDPAPYTRLIVSEGIKPWEAYVEAPVRKMIADGTLAREIGQALLKDLAKGAKRG